MADKVPLSLKVGALISNMGFDVKNGTEITFNLYIDDPDGFCACDGNRLFLMIGYGTTITVDLLGHGIKALKMLKGVDATSPGFLPVGGKPFDVNAHNLFIVIAPEVMDNVIAEMNGSAEEVMLDFSEQKINLQ